LDVYEISKKIDDMASFISSAIGDVKSSFDENYRTVNTAENPNNLPEEQVKKLTEIYVNLKDIGTNLLISNKCLNPNDSRRSILLFLSLK